MTRAMESREISEARRRVHNDLTGPLTTLATQMVVDPVTVVRPNYAGPRRAPSWWDDTTVDDIPPELVTQLGG